MKEKTQVEKREEREQHSAEVLNKVVELIESVQGDERQRVLRSLAVFYRLD